MKVRIASDTDLRVGELRRVEIGKRALVIGCSGPGRFFAMRDICPHHGSELSTGRLSGTVLPTKIFGEYRWGCDLEVIRCPRHNYEFDVNTGRQAFDPTSKLRVKVYAVTVEDGQLTVEIPQATAAEV